MRTFEFKYQDDIYEVEWVKTDESFDHEFGVYRGWGVDIKSIKMHVPAAIEEWIDIKEAVKGSFTDKLIEAIVASEESK